MTRPPLLEPAEAAQWLTAHPHWFLVDDHLLGGYEIDFDHSVRAIAVANDTIRNFDHHPRIILEYGKLVVELWTHDRGGVTELDLSVAHAFDVAVESAASTL